MEKVEKEEEDDDVLVGEEEGSDSERGILFKVLAHYYVVAM